MIVSTVLGKIISIFIIMVVGVICYKVGIIDNNTKEKLSRLSTLIVNPILIFMSFQMEYDTALLKNMGILFILAVISYVISIVLGHFLLHKKEGYDLAVEKFAVTYTNCGFIGVPLGYALFGSIGVIYATVFVATFHIFCWTHGILLLDNSGFQPKKLINPCLDRCLRRNYLLYLSTEDSDKHRICHEFHCRYEYAAGHALVRRYHGSVKL